MSVKTLLIGLDGATFTVLDPLMEQGLMPFLKSFFAQGVRAHLRTIVPPLTPPAWTSLMTGRTPGHHGVFDFFHLESADSRHIRFFSSLDVKCETVWSMTSRAGLRVTALNFPSMFPAPHLSGYVVPGWVPWRQLRLACWPEGLLDQLKNLPGFNQHELAMDIKLEERSTEGCAVPEEYAPWIGLHIRREQNWFEIFDHLTRTDASDLTAVLFDGVDKLQHLCWRFIHPEDNTQSLEADWEREARGLCLEYFRRLDNLIERMCDQVGPETTVLIASDHGFGPTNQIFHINQWLAERGYLAWSEAALNWDTQGALHGVGQVARHTWMLDWSRTRAYCATPTGNGLHIAVSHGGDAPGVPAAEYSSFRQKLMDDLLGFMDPATGKPVVERIWTRDEAFDGPCKEQGPDLTLALRDGGIVSILPTRDILVPRPEVAGQHRPLGVFGARGPGIRQGFDAGELSILDVAPLMLYSLNLAVPVEMQGRVPAEIWEAGLLERRPVQHAAAAPVNGVISNGNGTTAAMSPEDEEVVLERLRELGYIE